MVTFFLRQEQYVFGREVQEAATVIIFKGDFAQAHLGPILRTNIFMRFFYYIVCVYIETEEHCSYHESSKSAVCDCCHVVFFRSNAIQGNCDYNVATDKTANSGPKCFLRTRF